MPRPRLRLAFLAVCVIAFNVGTAAIACAQTTPVIYVTATPGTPIPNAEPTLPNPFLPTPTPFGPTATALQPTANPTPIPTPGVVAHTVQQGETLSLLAALYGAPLPNVLALNPGLTEASILQVGQVLNMPGQPVNTTPPNKLIPDSELVNSPAASRFDVAAYVRFQPGFIRVYSEDVGNGRVMSGAELVQFIATSASVNPRLLLALLEYRSGWITNPVPTNEQIAYPMGLVNPRVRGLLNQLDWAARQLNNGYYGWRTRGLRTLEFPDKSRLAFAPTLNGGTVGVQNYLALTAPNRQAWEYDVSPAGFFTTYMALFGDPFRYAIEPLIPPDLQAPELNFPFPRNEIWFLTSGPHGGWDARASGWAAIDFAPPRPPDALLAAQGACYLSPNTATAMAAGMVVRSADGAVVIDLDMDGDERTGWTLVYLHISDTDRVMAGAIVAAGAVIGRPSCEGFYLNSQGTHIHVARRYNGEWIVADCQACLPGVPKLPFILSGWEVKGYAGQVYQGWLQRGGEIRRAEQGRDDPTNQVWW